MMRKATAFVPAHVSGFFQPCYSKTPERTGSRNGGFCMDVGVLTEIEVTPASRTKVKVYIDGKPAPHANTTFTALNHLLVEIGGSFEVEARHFSQVPIGAGYGASGAGAFGSVLALSKALGLRFPKRRLAKVAHVAEVSCGTGLGDVGAQTIGGMVIATMPGAYPYGRWKRIRVPKNLRVVCATLSPLPTNRFLLDSSFMRRADKLGSLALEHVVKNQTVDGFIHASRKFAEGLGLVDEEMRELIRAGEKAGAMGVSQIMLGRSVFALVTDKKKDRLRDAFEKFLPPEQITVSRVAHGGATVLDR